MTTILSAAMGLFCIKVTDKLEPINPAPPVTKIFIMPLLPLKGSESHLAARYAHTLYPKNSPQPPEGDDFVIGKVVKKHSASSDNAGVHGGKM